MQVQFNLNIKRVLVVRGYGVDRVSIELNNIGLISKGFSIVFDCEQGKAEERLNELAGKEINFPIEVLTYK